ncbi:hypothetical protein D3C83_184560 [compost metagenome]
MRLDFLHRVLGHSFELRAVLRRRSDGQELMNHVARALLRVVVLVLVLHEREIDRGSSVVRVARLAHVDVARERVGALRQ